jgi:hypothetical protein
VKRKGIREAFLRRESGDRIIEGRKGGSIHGTWFKLNIKTSDRRYQFSGMWCCATG